MDPDLEMMEVLDLHAVDVEEPAIAEPVESVDLDREAYELARREQRLGVTADLVVVLHESRAKLERYLPRMLAAAARVDGRVICVDNASTDGVADWLRSLDDGRLQIAEMGANRGFAAAVNAGAAVSEAEYLVVLNPDVAIDDADAIRDLVLHLERNPRAGAAAPRLRFTDGELQRSARPVPSVGKLVGRQTVLGRTPWGRRAAERYLALPEDEHVSCVDWVIGAAVAVRREAFDAIGGWDERFFLYFEDVDFCVRLRSAGHEVHYVTCVEMGHDYTRASDRANGSVLRSRTRRHHVASALRFFAKHPGLALTGRGEPGGWAALLGATLRRAADVVVASVLLVMLAPLLAAIAVAVRLDSPGPALFRQQRVGRHKRTFTMWKFRTMAAEADAMVHERFVRSMILEGKPPCYDELERPVWKLTDDPRVTRVGGLLRRWSLDELPQLVNVLRGDMTLVGFRPAIPYELKYYPDWYHRRFTVKPGMTGLWQVSGRNERSYEEMVSIDLDYVARRCLALDALVLVKTAQVVLQRRGAV